MNTTYKLIFSSVALSLFCCYNGLDEMFAQNAKKDSTLNQSMTIERDFSPIVKDANKIDHMPAVQEFKVKKSPTRYADWQPSEARSREIGKMPAGQVIAVEDRYNNGFIDFSAGNYLNANLDAGIYYNNLALEADGFISNGSYDLPYKDIRLDDNSNPITNQWDNKVFNGNVKASYDKIFSNESRIHMYAGASVHNNTMLNYYHYSAAKRQENLEYLYGINTNGYYLKDELASEKKNDETKKQKFNNFNAGISYDISGFLADLSFIHSSVALADLSENTIKFKTGYGWYYEEGWQFKALLNLGYTSTKENYFTVMPELEYSKFGEDSFSRFYLNVKGGIRRPDLYELMTVVPYAIPASSFETEKQLFDATIGYEDNNNGEFKWGIYAAADMTMDRIEAVMTSSTEDTFAPTYARLTRKDALNIKGGMYFDYEHSRFFGMKGGIDIETNPRYNNSVLDFNVHILSNPFHSLFFDFGLDGKIKRDMDFEYSDFGNDQIYTTEIDLGNIFDLGFKVEYKLKENLSIYAFGKNLLNQEVQFMPGIPMQKINIHAGFNWKF